ncbi:unnamed protein product [Spirodela intermedia]|uniref:TOG domain-containing protein n=1 Tax=Spirodela intermedia TaxID=51605 RepID=A0A7I8L8U7_SPIIN|nr:unnamed protein product [Spirodela intermedia]
MALRSLDNALPALQERPRKIAKVAAVKAEDLVVATDENLAPPANAAEASVEYVASCDLLPLDDPETKVERLLEDLDSKDWLKVCEALNVVRRLALHHSSLMLPILDKVMLVTMKAMKNPRSALCKTSIMASTDIISSSLGRTLLLNKDGAFDQLLLQLLLKASQDKKFVCEEAEKSLHEMARSLPPIPLLKRLHLYVKHANLKVRAKAAVYMSHCVSKMDFGVMKEFGLGNILHMAADLLNDRLPAARESARGMINSVHRAFCGDHGRGEERNGSEPSQLWQDFCFSNLRPSAAQSIAKIILQ